VPAPTRIADGLDVTIAAAMASDITCVRSMSDALPIAETGGGRSRMITLANGRAQLHTDLIVHIATARPHQPRCLMEASSELGTTACAVTLAPKIALDDAKCEFVFVIDRSGSMSGTKIEQARRALQLFLKSLPEDCYFNIIGFGSRYVQLFADGSQRYGADTLQRAMRHATNLAADLGGTQILAPLRTALGRTAIKGYARQILLITDGEVSNTAEVIAAARDGATNARIFTLGIGSGASHELVEGVARAANGTADFVLDQGLERVVIRQLTHAMQPALTDVRIEWEGFAPAPPPGYSARIETEPEPQQQQQQPHQPAPKSVFGAFASGIVGSLLDFDARTPEPEDPAVKAGIARAPMHAPPVFSGSRYLSYCIVEQGATPPTSAHITATTPAGPIDVRIAITSADTVQGSTIHKLAARAMVRDLEDGRSWLGATGKTDTVNAAITKLALTHGLTSRCTSYVAVHPPPSRPSPMMAQCSARAMLCSASHTFAKAKPTKKKASFGMRSSSRGRGGGSGDSILGRIFSRRLTAAPPPAPSGPPPPCEAKNGLLNASLAENCRRMCSSNSDNDDDSEDDWAGDVCDMMDETQAEEETHVLAKERAEHATVSEARKRRTRPSKVCSSGDSGALDAIVALQAFDGAFDAGAALARATGITETAMATAAASLDGIDHALALRIIATAIAIAVLRCRLSQYAAEWALLEAKASKWLASAACGAGARATALANNLVVAA